MVCGLAARRFYPERKRRENVAYQALYRKWRPRTFDDVVGQQHITETLKRQVAGDRLSHAYLFVGTRGTGKTTCAKILSRAVNCEHPVDGNPCNECASCRGIEDGSILEVVEIDAASNNGVDNVRELREEAMYSPASVRRRVYIIDEVHMLSASAFNALLKILEEPPEHLLFILATTELNKVPATILSRCQRFHFRRISTEDIAERVRLVAAREGIGLTDDGAALLARLADGGLRDALSLLDQCGSGNVDTERILQTVGMAGAQEILTLFRSLRKGDCPAVLKQTDRLYRGGKDMGVLIGELQTLLRDVLLFRLSGKESEALLSGTFRPEELQAAAKGLEPSAVMEWLEILQAAAGERGSPKAARLSAELALIRLCSARARTDEAALAARVAALEQKLEQGGIPGTFPAEENTQKEESVRAGDRETSVSEETVPEEDPVSPEGEETPTEGPAETEEPAAETTAGDPWQEMLRYLKTETDAPTYSLLADGGAYQGVRRGNRLILRCMNPFARSMAEASDMQVKLRKAAEQAFGQPMALVLTEDEVPEEAEPSPETKDKLDRLARYDIVRFK